MWSKSRRNVKFGGGEQTKLPKTEVALGHFQSAHLQNWKSVIGDVFCGRLVLDVAVSAKELVRCKSYDLDQLVDEILKGQRNGVPVVANCYS